MAAAAILMATAAGVDLLAAWMLVGSPHRWPTIDARWVPALPLAAETAVPPWVVLHVGASLLVGVAAWASARPELRRPAGPMLAWLVMFNLLVPSAPLWWRCAVWAGDRWRILRRHDPVGSISEPEYTLHARRQAPAVGRTRLRTNLTNPEVPDAQRVAALLAIHDIPASVTSGLLRQLLADPQDDMRLLAYGMLDGKEKAISNRLLAEEAALKTSADAAARFGSHKRIAELHWELVAQRLVQGDVRMHACRQSRTHARSALAIDAADGGLWLLLARLELVLGDMEDGRRALENAETNGLPRSLLLPLIAEYDFLQRRFAGVRRAFDELGSAPGTLQLAAAWRYWTGREAAHR